MFGVSTQFQGLIKIHDLRQRQEDWMRIYLNGVLDRQETLEVANSFGFKVLKVYHSPLQERLLLMGIVGH